MRRPYPSPFGIGSATQARGRGVWDITGFNKKLYFAKVYSCEISILADLHCLASHGRISCVLIPVYIFIYTEYICKFSLYNDIPSVYNLKI